MIRAIRGLSWTWGAGPGPQPQESGGRAEQGLRSVCVSGARCRLFRLGTFCPFSIHSLSYSVSSLKAVTETWPWGTSAPAGGPGSPGQEVCGRPLCLLYWREGPGAVRVASARKWPQFWDRWDVLCVYLTCTRSLLCIRLLSPPLQIPHTSEISQYLPFSVWLFLLHIMANHSSILAWRISMDRGAWRAMVHRVAESDTTEAT